MDTSLYFYRNVILSMVNNEVSLIDIYNPSEKGETLEPWFGLVLQLANGQRSIDDLLQYLSRGYGGNPPGNLEATVHSVIGRLVNLKFIVLTKEATELPYYLAHPYEQLDVDKAKRLLEEDQVNLN